MYYVLHPELQSSGTISNSFLEWISNHSTLKLSRAAAYLLIPLSYTEQVWSVYRMTECQASCHGDNGGGGLDILEVFALVIRGIVFMA